MRRRPDLPAPMEMGPASLPTPLAPVAMTGVPAPMLTPEEYPQGAIAPGARAGIRSRQEADPAHGAFTTVLAVPRSGLPWGLYASSGSVRAEAFAGSIHVEPVIPACDSVAWRLFHRICQ